jgi:hypothetical protein
MKTQAIWHLFVEKSLDILADGGYLVMVHPDGWRGVDGKFKHIQDMIKSRQTLYLELHNEKDGVKTFGANTTYDFYCVRNNKNENHITKVKCVDGSIENVNLSKMDFIPNGKFGEFNSLIAKKNQARVEMLDTNYCYAHRKPNMSKTKTDDFKFPCVYTTLQDGSMNIWYSNTKEFGHFNLPKVIWSNGGASTPIVDMNGQYGLMEYAYAIIDDEENLEDIKRALLNPKFLELMKYADGLAHRYNRKVIAIFRKDFYKEFI